MMKRNQYNELLNMAQQALRCVQDFPDMEQKRARGKIEEIIRLLEEEKEPGTWDIDLLTYGSELVRNYDSPEYYTKLNPLLSFYRNLWGEIYH